MSRRKKRATVRLVDECMTIAGILLDADAESLLGDHKSAVACLAEASARIKRLRNSVCSVAETMKPKQIVTEATNG